MLQRTAGFGDVMTSLTATRRTLQAGQPLRAAATLPTSFSALTPNAA